MFARKIFFQTKYRRTNIMCVCVCVQRVYGQWININIFLANFAIERFFRWFGIVVDIFIVKWMNCIHVKYGIHPRLQIFQCCSFSECMCCAAWNWATTITTKLKNNNIVLVMHSNKMFTLKCTNEYCNWTELYFSTNANAEWLPNWNWFSKLKNTFISWVKISVRLKFIQIFGQKEYHCIRGREIQLVSCAKAVRKTVKNTRELINSSNYI